MDAAHHRFFAGELERDASGPWPTPPLLPADTASIGRAGMTYLKRQPQWLASIRAR